ncbi:MAG: 30S ribosomal protein S7 [Candidatus Omnitrophica bacterium]|nr:30S ribosomal protein S7 [Candidatus Omnitrophota bacterium]MCM8808626.1 30S ribosomal protein S7 [Candidatus Omnitrophota bacterium]MCM8810682.1 30S ribosomal protein S7 [Candidatus Omnitrophota bacterium]MCM8833353.1 30S ribosomal protein S7 [Candidatus Omnitrophota bacterium]
MPRRKRAEKRIIEPDPKYNDYEVAKFINKLMWDGKKTVAYKIFYTAMDIIKEKTNQDPLTVFKKALNNVKPKLEVRPRRVGGATYQIPMEVPPHRSLSLAIRWIVESARSRKGKPMALRLVDEILEAAKGEGPSVKKKEDTHKMAESNRAFAHYRW